jgi:hypothetical protein
VVYGRVSPFFYRTQNSCDREVLESNMFKDYENTKNGCKKEQEPYNVILSPGGTRSDYNDALFGLQIGPSDWNID